MMPNTVKELLDILGTYGVIGKRVDKHNNHFDRFVYVLYYRDGIYQAHGYSPLTAAKNLYRKTQEMMLNSIGAENIEL